MIYGQDAPVALPVIDLYDTGAMRMYVEAAREQYQQGLKDYETFMSQYGDFASPFKKDVDYWDKNIMGPVINKINYYYERGIDPTRNAEARADLQRTMRSIPRTTASQMKVNAARGEAYLKELGKLAAQGKYDQNQNNFYLQQMGYPSFEDFSTEKYGTWGLESPVEASSLFDNTKEWFAGMKPGEMTPEQVDAMMGKGYAKPGYTYTGIPENRLREIIEQRIPGWLDTFQGKFFRENARERAKALYGDQYTEDLANKMLMDDIVTANRRSLVYPERKLDKLTELAVENRYAMQRQAASDRAARNRAYQTWILNNSVPDENGNPVLVSGGGSNQETQDIPLGAADQAETNQHAQYENLFKSFLDSYGSKLKGYKVESDNKYNKLNADNKKAASLYKKYYSILNDIKSTKDQKDSAKQNIDKLNNKRDANFVSWKQSFINSQHNTPADILYAWEGNTTTQGRAGYKLQDAVKLHENAAKIFKEYNIVSDLTAPQKSEISSLLGYTKADDDGNLSGKMDKNRNVQDIIMAKATGNRMYRYSQIPRKVARIIAGKKYKILADNLQDREYAVGILNRKKNIIINELATFDDESVRNELANMSITELKKFGITKNSDESWNIPISSTYGHGQGWSDVNSQTDKRLGGSEKFRPTRNAREAQKQFYE